MTESELIEASRKALEEAARRPPEERWRQWIAWGMINEKGEVLWGEDPEEKAQDQEQPGAANGSAPK